MTLAVAISAALFLLIAGTWLFEIVFRALRLAFVAGCWTLAVLAWLTWAALNPREAAAQWRAAEHLRKAGLLAGGGLTARP